MKGKIAIDRDLCKGCGFCMTACSKRLIIFDERFNPMSYHIAVPVNIDRCNGCGLCAVMCPEIAIQVWREDKQMQNAKCKTQNYGS